MDVIIDRLKVIKYQTVPTSSGVTDFVLTIRDESNVVVFTSPMTEINTGVYIAGWTPTVEDSFTGYVESSSLGVYYAFDIYVVRAPLTPQDVRDAMTLNPTLGAAGNSIDARLDRIEEETLKKDI